jgi:hypothetical protein
MVVANSTGLRIGAEAKASLKALRRSLGQAGFALPGSVAVRSYRCGKANCACHGDPPRLHGPYIQWSRSVGGRTVHRRLSEDQLADYQVLFDNARRLKEMMAELESLTLGIVEDDDRWPRR